MTNRVWAVVPAAGVGSRFRASKPKQYSGLGSSTLIEQTLQQLIKSGVFSGIVVAISESDQRFSQLAVASQPLIRTVSGSSSRASSVLSGLRALAKESGPHDWVMVHDAARPLVATSDILRLKEHLEKHQRAAILGCPVADTVKRVTDGGLLASADEDPRQAQTIIGTVDRRELWVAQTPQAAQLDTLLAVLEQLDADNKLDEVTDEASALEMRGHQVDIVEGNRANFKVTLPEDLLMAEAILKSQETSS